MQYYLLLISAFSVSHRALQTRAILGEDVCPTLSNENQSRTLIWKQYIQKPVSVKFTRMQHSDAEPNNVQLDSEALGCLELTW